MVAPPISYANQVVLNARSEDKLRGVADEINASGGDVAIAVGDVSKVNKILLEIIRYIQFIPHFFANKYCRCTCCPAACLTLFYVVLGSI